MGSPPPTKVAILGGGRGGTALLDLLGLLPDIEIVGVADKDPFAPGVVRARELNILTTNDVLELLTQQELNLVIDVTGDPQVGPLIEQHRRPGLEILDGAAARLLWDLVQHLSRLQGQLFQAEKLAGIGSFAAGIAHDINNPLHLILGYAETILEERDLDTIHEYGREIIHAVQRISPICKDLTQYARRTIASNLTDVDLNTKLDEALKISRYATVLQDLVVVKRYGVIPPVLAKPEEVLHALVNLLTNAIQAMDGRGTLTLMTESRNGSVTASIADSGCGIAPEHLGQIFDPFFTTKAPGKGTGLGLYNVRSIVTRFHGSIDVESVVGQGTTFHVRFPVT
jgi:signal transduction histidine kinase